MPCVNLGENMALKLINRHVALLLIVFLVLFCLVFSIQINTPLHSDDYSYFFNGGDVGKIYHHYVSWSGRLSADITSSTMLYYLGKTAYSALNSAGLIALVFLISYLPANISNRSVNYNDIAICSIIFLAYWVANTNLGQTTFWIVGSANYLWTNLYILIYLNLLIALTRINSKYYIFSLCLFVTGFIAGCTNENTGIFSFLFTILVWLAFEIKNKNNKHLMFLMGSIGSLLGWLILVFAPGNLLRAKHISFSNWYHQTVSWRIDEHLYTRFPAMMDNYWQVFLVTIFVLIAFSLGKNDEKSKNNDIAKAAIFFFFASILSVLLMIGSPAIPERSGNGTLVLLLVMFSIIANIQQNNEVKKTIYIHLLPITFLLIYFIPSYYLVFKAYSATHYQEVIRENIIKSAKENGEKTIIIPDFNFTRLIKVSDKFDSHHNAKKMGKYWGVDQINVYQVPFNYGVIVDKNKSIKTVRLNKELTDGVSVYRVFIYEAPKKPFYKSETHLMTELSINPENLPKNKMIYMHLRGKGISSKGGDFVEKYGFINADIGRKTGYLIGDKYYIDQLLSDTITASDIDNIDIGVYP